MRKNNCYVKIVFIEIIISAIIILFQDIIDNKISGLVISRQKKNKKRYIYFRGGQLSVWSLLHVLLFMFLAYICPNSLPFIIISGIVWELFELYFEYDVQTTRSSLMCKYVNDCNRGEKITTKEFWELYTGKKETTQNDLFYCSSGFYGQLLDIFCNIIGVSIGSYLASR